MKNVDARSSSGKAEKTDEPAKQRTLIRPLNQEEQECLSTDAIVLRYTSPNQPFKLHSKNIVSPQTTTLQPNEVLVEVKGVALGHTDLYYNDNDKFDGVSSSIQDSNIDLDSMMDAYEPMGHELYGIVVNVGDSVEKIQVKTGDAVDTEKIQPGVHVLVNYHVGCGICKWCVSDQNNVCPSLKIEFGYRKDGSHRLVKYCKVPHENIIVIPSSINNLLGTKICTGVSLAVHATKLARLSSSSQNEQWCVVLGAMNTVSCHLIQLLKKVYGAQVIAVIPPLNDIKETQNVTEHLRTLQTNHIINMDDKETTTDNLASLIRTYTNGDGADVIFDCIGVPTQPILQSCMGWTGALGRRGRLMLMGYHSENSSEQLSVHPMPTIVYEQSVVGCVGATMEDLQDAMDYVINGTIEVILDPTRPKHQPQTII